MATKTTTEKTATKKACAKAVDLAKAMSAKPRATTVDGYINAAPPEAQKNLREIRAILNEVAPNAVETIKWGWPVYEENRIMFSFAAFRKHMTFMPTRKTLVHIENELKDFTTGKDTIQFRYDKPLPKSLIKKIATHRAKDVRENDARWM